MQHREVRDKHGTTELFKSRQVCDRNECLVIIFTVTLGKDEIADMGGKTSRATSTLDLRFGGDRFLITTSSREIMTLLDKFVPSMGDLITTPSRQPPVSLGPSQALVKAAHQSVSVTWLVVNGQVVDDV